MKIPSIITSRVSDILAREERPKSSFSSIPKLIPGSLKALLVLATVSFLPITSYASDVTNPGPEDVKCPQNAQAAWNAANELVGALPGLGEFAKIGVALSKIARFSICGDQAANMTRQIQVIARKEINQAMIDQVRSKSQAVSKLISTDPTPNDYVQEAIAVDLATIEAEAKLLSFEVLPFATTISALKLGIRKTLVEKALRNSPDGEDMTRTSEYFGNVTLMLSAIDETEGAFNKIEDNFIKYLNENVTYRIQYLRDNSDTPSISAIGIVVYPDGTESPSSLTGTYADTLWRDCDGVTRDSYNKVTNLVKINVEPRAGQARIVLRDKVLTKDYKEMRENLKVLRRELLADLNLRNLAFKKTATQSQTSNTDVQARGAVDGVLNAARNAIANSQNGSKPWWKVDLGRMQAVESVGFISNSSSDAAFKVELFDDKNASAPVWTELVDPSESTRKIAIFRSFPTWKWAAKKGRFVKITLLGTEALKLSEVYVLGANIARGMPAAQSSTIHGSGAWLATDGSTNGDYSYGSVSHTNFDKNPWWRVDLGANFNIGSVHIYNRTDAASSRLSNFTVTVRDDSGNVMFTKLYSSGPVGNSPLKLSLGTQVWGQYVTIKLEGQVSSYLHLAEVEVYRPVDAN